MRPVGALLIPGPMSGNNGAVQVLPGGLNLARPPVQLLSAGHAGAINGMTNGMTNGTTLTGTTLTGSTLCPWRS
jgi:hypothetical protein